jgi:hypothetical protein
VQGTNTLYLQLWGSSSGAINVDAIALASDPASDGFCPCPLADGSDGCRNH